jgi:Fe(3+) dicitrate transport protein
MSIQLTYVSSQFTEASNSKIEHNDNTYGIFEKSLFIMLLDFFSFVQWKAEAGRV